MSKSRDPEIGSNESTKILPAKRTVPGSVGSGIAAAIGAAIGGPEGAASAAAAEAAAEDVIRDSGTPLIFDPEEEMEHWRSQYPSRPYYDPARSFANFEPAFRYGWESHRRNSSRSWEDISADLEGGWPRARGRSSLTWEHAKQAVRDAWDRLAGNPDASASTRNRSSK